MGKGRETEIEKIIRLISEERIKRQSRGEDTFSFKPILIDNGKDIEFQGKKSDGNNDISDFFIKTQDINIYEKNILEYKVLLQVSEGNYRLSKLEILENKHLLNAVFILTKFENKKYFTLIYKGNDKILEEKSEREYYLSYPYERIMFCSFSNHDNLFSYYEFSYITLKRSLIGKSKEGRISILRINYAKKINTPKIKVDINQKIIIEKKDYIYFFISRSNNKWFKIISYFCDNELISMKKMPNQFLDDSSENYMIEIEKNKKFEISFIDFCCTKGELYGFKIYEKPVQILLDYMCAPFGEENSDLLSEKIYYYSLNKENEIYLKNQYMEIIRNIKNILKQKDIQKLVTKMHYLEYTSDNCKSLIDEFFIKNNINTLSLEDCLNNNISEQLLDEYRKIANDIFDNLVERGQIDIIWKNEYKLYRLIKKYFPSAIFQYHARWLGLQSLDIYIPEKKLGIEYQGEQHFKSNDFFGGDYGLNLIQKRDEKKSIYCERRNIKLLYWNYDSEVNEENVKKFLSVEHIV